MKANIAQTFKILRIVAWIVFIVLLVKAGAIIMTFGLSVNNPEAATDMYLGMNLARYEQFQFTHYTIIASYHILLSIAQAYVALFIARLLKVEEVKDIFTHDVLRLLTKISVTIAIAGIAGLMHNIHVAALEYFNGITAIYFSVAHLFLTAALFVLAVICKMAIGARVDNEFAV